MTTPQFELFCDDPRHGRDRRGKPRIVAIAKFRKVSPMPLGGYQKRVPGQKIERLPEVWTIEPGASAERRKLQRAWTPPADDPVADKLDPMDKSWNFDRFLAEFRPGDDNSPGTYQMARDERVRPGRAFTHPGEPVREKFERACESPGTPPGARRCTRRVDRYLDDLGGLFDMLTAAGVSRINIETLGAMLAEQAKRRR